MENAEIEAEKVRLQGRSKDEELVKLRKAARLAASHTTIKPSESSSKREEQLQSEVAQLMVSSPSKYTCWMYTLTQPPFLVYTAVFYLQD